MDRLDNWRKGFTGEQTPGEPEDVARENLDLELLEYELERERDDELDAS